MCRPDDFPPYDLTVGRLLDTIGREDVRDLPVRVAGAGDWPYAIAGAAIVDAAGPWPRSLLLVLGDQLDPDDHADAIVADITGAP